MSIDREMILRTGYHWLHSMHVDEPLHANPYRHRNRVSICLRFYFLPHHKNPRLLFYTFHHGYAGKHLLPHPDHELRASSHFVLFVRRMYC